jgi:hypothetical protein
MRGNPRFPLIARAAAPQALLSFRARMGLFKKEFSSPRLRVKVDKVMAGGTPANPAALERRF